MKKMTVSGVRLCFWFEGKILFCRVEKTGDVLCCGSKPIPGSEEEALKLLSSAWIW